MKTSTVLIRRLYTEFDLETPSGVAAAMRLALASGAKPAVLDALRFRMQRARERPAREAEAAALVGR